MSFGAWPRLGNSNQAHCFFLTPCPQQTSVIYLAKLSGLYASPTETNVYSKQQCRQPLSRNPNIQTWNLFVGLPWWLRICLPMQGMWIQPLVWEDSTCCGAARPLLHNSSAHMPRAVLCYKKSHRNEKLAHHSWRKTARSNRDPGQPKINK